MSKRLCVLILLTLGGCETTQKLPERTAGLTLDLQLSAADNAHMLYRVDKTGVLRFGGGLDALMGNYNWEGPLTDEEIAEIRTFVVDRYRWYDRTPESTDEPEDMRWRVTVKVPQGRRRFKVDGENSELRSVQEILATAAERRFKPELDALPKPGPQPRSSR